MTQNGKLQQALIPAKGTLKIGKNLFTWKGSSETTKSDLTVFGMFNLNITKTALNGQTRRKIIVKTQFISCLSTELLLAIQLKKGKATLAQISTKPINLTKFAYVLKGKSSKLKKCKIGQTIKELDCNKTIFRDTPDLCSASFSLGKTKSQLINNLKHQLIYPQNKEPKPLSKKYLKSWSVVMETKNNIIFFINDARPNIKNQKGITIFELQEILINKFNYLWGCVGDSGQSSKLMLVNQGNKEVFGNMHYQNYRYDPPVWDGVNGRSIPVALLAYE